MKLNGLSLVNWHLFDPIDIPINGNTAITGDNGSGKSTLLDAIQTVLFGANERYAQLNARSSKGKNHRDIKSYALGYWKPEGEQGEIRRERGESITYLCLNFKDDEGFVNLLVGLEVTESAKNVPILAVGRSDKPLSCEYFIKRDGDRYDVKMIHEAKQHLLAAGFNLKYCANSTEYISDMARALGPKKHHHWIDPLVLSKALSRSLSLGDLGDVTSISDFVERFVLEEAPLEIDAIISAKNNYQSILESIEEDERKLAKLKPIERKVDYALRTHKKRDALHWLYLEEQIGRNEIVIEDNLESRLQASKMTGRVFRERWLAESDEKRLQSKSIALQVAIQSDNGQQEYDALTRERDDKTEKANNLAVSLRALTQRIHSYCDLPIGIALPNVDIKNVSQMNKLVAVDESKINFIKIDKLLPDFTKTVSGVAAIADASRRQIGSEIEQLKAEISELDEKIRSAQSGQSPISRKTLMVQSALEKAGIKATPVCQLATVSDPSWQPAIEALLGAGVEALICDPKDEVSALRIYRKLQNSADIYGVLIVKTNQCKHWLNQYQENSAAALIESTNELAKAYLHHRLGNYVLVDTEEELSKGRYAITKDGMSSSPSSVTRLRLSDTFRMVVDQSQNIALWESSIKRTTQQQGDLETRDRQLKKVNLESENLSILLSGVEEPLDVIHRRKESLMAEAELADKKRKAIDLTALEDKKSELETVEADLAKAQAAYKLSLQQLQLARGQKATCNETITSLTAINNERLIPERNKAEQSAFYDPQFADELTGKYDPISDANLDDIKKKVEDLRVSAANLITESKALLQDYCNNVFNFMGDRTLEDASQLAEISHEVHMQIESIEHDNLVKHKTDAQKAKHAMNLIFRADMITKLKEQFDNLDSQFSSLNKALSGKEFHGSVYRFTNKPHPQYVDLISHVRAISQLDTENVGDMFDETPEIVEKQIEALINGDGEGVIDIRDYRKYYNYDVVITDKKSDTSTRLSKLLGTGSGGEKQAPFYMTVASSLASAWRTLRAPGESVGLVLLDEAFNNLSETNLINAIRFMNDVGLQVITATPPEKEVIFRTVMDTNIFLTKDGRTVDVDVDIMKLQGRKMFLDSNPALNRPSAADNDNASVVNA